MTTHEQLPRRDAQLDAWILAQAALDFETPAARCEVQHTREFCDETPRWVGRCVMCDRTALYCDTARDEFVDAFRQGIRLACASCGSVSSLSHPRYQFTLLADS